jgi:thiol-disulfide isomerase/thioredoxin
MIRKMDLFESFQNGLAYDDFLLHYASETEKVYWQHVYDSVEIAPHQTQLLQSFVRKMNVLCMAGTWCGDCAAQCPIFRRFEQNANSKIVFRLVDRDTDPCLAEKLRICGSPRVPQIVFFSEDGLLVGSYGDRTLSKYRELALPLGRVASLTVDSRPGVNSQSAVIQDWLNEFERVQHLLRLSPSLRQKHGD